MRVLVAFDKFKDSLTAHEACDVTADALALCQPDWKVDCAPLADGGEGFAEILTRQAGGELRPMEVTGPRGAATTASYGLVSADRIPASARSTLGITPAAGNRIAIIEMAAASGLALLKPNERDVWQTTTAGTGELLRAAADMGASAMLLGVGGSATHDLGLGALAALGLECRSDAGARISPPVPANWPRIARLDGRSLRLPPILIACDVTNPLLGSNGAAAVYGPQKGLHRSDVTRLDHETARIALLLCSHFRQPDTLMDLPGAGAAGGIAFGLMVGAGAKLLPGFTFVSQWLDLDAKLAAADLVITGEGRFDESSLGGKGPGAIAARALALGKPVYIFAGTIAPNLRFPGKPPFPFGSGAQSDRPVAFSAHAITPPSADLARALREGRSNLKATVARVFGPQHPRRATGSAGSN